MSTFDVGVATTVGVSGLGMGERALSTVTVMTGTGTGPEVTGERESDLLSPTGLGFGTDRSAIAAPEDDSKGTTDGTLPPQVDEETDELATAGRPSMQLEEGPLADVRSIMTGLGAFFRFFFGLIAMFSLSSAFRLPMEGFTPIFYNERRLKNDKRNLTHSLKSLAGENNGSNQDTCALQTPGVSSLLDTSKTRGISCTLLR